MTHNILHPLRRDFFYPLLAALLLTACSKEEQMPVPQGWEIEISITDPGFGTSGTRAEDTRAEDTPAEDTRATPTTRTVEHGTRTEFVAGDECALFVVHDGAVQCYKLTAVENAGQIAWQVGSSDAPFHVQNLNDHYFLCYPYKADTSDLLPEESDDEAFFRTRIQSWQPTADQSTPQAYAASDLMTAQGRLQMMGGNKANLYFTLTHRMALAVVEMPATRYKFTNSITIDDYIVPIPATFTSTAKPLRMADGTYRHLFNPNASPSLEGMYQNGDNSHVFSFAASCQAGTCKRYRVDPNTVIEKSHLLQVNEWLCKDGSLLSKDETRNNDCIGLVFYLDHNPNDDCDYSRTGIGQQKCHGYVVALEDASKECQWGSKYKLIGNKPISAPINDWNGYDHTQRIINAVGGKSCLNGTSQEGYPATYYAVVDYERRCPAPPNSSGWFLPSAGQISVVAQSDLHDRGTSAIMSPQEWSSSEVDSNSAYRGEDCGTNYKIEQNPVRSVLAF